MSRSLLPQRTQLSLEGLGSPLLTQPGNFFGQTVQSQYLPFVAAMRSALAAGLTAVEWSAVSELPEASALSATIRRNILLEHDYWVAQPGEDQSLITVSWAESNPYSPAYVYVDPQPIAAQLQQQVDRMNLEAAAARDREQGLV